MKSSFPADASQITAAWLESSLKPVSTDYRLGAFQVERTGTGQIGENVRITLQWHGSPGDANAAPTSVVAKFASSDATSRATGVALGNYRREVAFYRHVAPRSEIRLAQCWAAEFDESTDNFVLLLEDLTPGVVGDQLQGCSLEHAEVVVDSAATWHRSWWEHSLLDEFGTWMSGPPDPTSVAQLEMLWGMAWPAFLERHPDKFTDDQRALATEFGSVVASWANRERGPRTIIHGDYRVDNMLFGGDHHRWVVPVDWQTPAIGPGIRDVAYFLGASLLADDRRRSEERLVRRWWDQIPQHAYDWDTCWTEYQRAALDGLVVAVVASLITVRTPRGDDMFYAMASRHLTTALDHGGSALLHY